MNSDAAMHSTQAQAPPTPTCLRLHFGFTEPTAERRLNAVFAPHFLRRSLHASITSRHVNYMRYNLVGRPALPPFASTHIAVGAGAQLLITEIVSRVLLGRETRIMRTSSVLSHLQAQMEPKTKRTSPEKPMAEIEKVYALRVPPIIQHLSAAAIPDREDGDVPDGLLYSRFTLTQSTDQIRKDEAGENGRGAKGVYLELSGRETETRDKRQTRE
ncbi:hypothetical protein B0F90DRAFT_1667987 [Multifurca ochricompacta]|uniref:Uncharacterized protein n=1 Tax=Multifurca ochricompacta TaxID=376703 RepID=A0AAD4M3T3_9AGAM|nr:hypothetical protein B0F90DRAFT_1667987 [Multifurca ochricompacta]